MILNENEFYDTYVIADLLDEKKKKTYVIYQNHSLSVINDSDEKQWTQISIRKHVLIDETSVRTSEMSVSVKKTS